MWRPKKLGIKGESLGNVHFAIDYLANPDSYELGDTVAIIGMGNSAMDVARTALRKGSRRVTLYARGLTSQASDHETTYAKLDGAELAFGWQPVEINDDGPVFKKKILFDEEGNQTGIDPTPVQVQADSVHHLHQPGTEEQVGQHHGRSEGIGNGLLVTNSFGETTHSGIFAAGDVVLGAKTVVQATAYAKKVADAMDKYMRGEFADASQARQADIHENSCPSAQLQRPPVFLRQLDEGVGGIGQIAAALAADGDIPDGMGWHGEEGHIFEGAAVGTGGEEGRNYRAADAGGDHLQGVDGALGIEQGFGRKTAGFKMTGQHTEHSGLLCTSWQKGRFAGGRDPAPHSGSFLFPGRTGRPDGRRGQQKAALPLPAACKCHRCAGLPIR